MMTSFKACNIAADVANGIEVDPAVILDAVMSLTSNRRATGLERVAIENALEVFSETPPAELSKKVLDMLVSSE